MGLESGSAVSALPLSLITRTSDALGENSIRLVFGMRRKLMPVQNDLCFRKCRDEAAHRGAVTAQGRMSAAADPVDSKSVSFRERLLQKVSQNLEADITQIGGAKA